MKLRGVIESGKGQGAFFTSLDWVVKQFENAMGFKPFPGTLNVRVSAEDAESLTALRNRRDFELIPDDPQFCSAGAAHVTINGIRAALVFPSEDVSVHDSEVVEVIADRNIKEALCLGDGDRVVISCEDDRPRRASIRR